MWSIRVAEVWVTLVGWAIIWDRLNYTHKVCNCLEDGELDRQSMFISPIISITLHSLKAFSIMFEKWTKNPQLQSNGRYMVHTSRGVFLLVPTSNQIASKLVLSIGPLFSYIWTHQGSRWPHHLHGHTPPQPHPLHGHTCFFCELCIQVLISHRQECHSLAMPHWKRGTSYHCCQDS